MRKNRNHEDNSYPHLSPTTSDHNGVGDLQERESVLHVELDNHQAQISGELEEEIQWQLGKF